MSLEYFHPAVQNWFKKSFSGPTIAQQQAWPAISQNQHTLIAAPTGSGKTLAAFLAAIDKLIKRGVEHKLDDQTYILYVSPLKALSNDIQKNLQAPLQGITEELSNLQLPNVNITAMVRTGDTPPGERQKMRKQAPHILVTTPESLFILLTSDSGRTMLSTVTTVIIDEIHAVANNKRGAHLSLSIERLEALTYNTQHKKLTRIGLSATQKPLSSIAQYLLGNQNNNCTIIDSGYQRDRDLAIEVPSSPLSAVMSNEVWQEIYDRLTELIQTHSTTLIFVNNRRLAERAARHLAERIGENAIAAHHGSLAREHRLDAEQRLKNGQLKAMVATASLELGIDIGDIDLVCQIASPRGIANFLQRVGRSGHSINTIPKGRLFATSRDDLVECTALLDSIHNGSMDHIEVIGPAIDVLTQHIIAEVSAQETCDETQLFQSLTAAQPYQSLKPETFDTILTMLADGFTTRRGRRSAYIYRDGVNKILRPRKGARLTVMTNAGAIPDQFDYDVILEPDAQFIGTLNEDFAFESLPGDIFQLGNTSYRILRTENGKVRVEDAHGQPPNIPFWFGDAPGRSDQLSLAVSNLRLQIDEKLSSSSIDNTIEWVVKNKKLSGQAAVQLVEYLAATQAALGAIPSQQHIVFERFFDQIGDQHLVIHSPYGSRINRAWGLALRKKFCRKFNFELQAAALEDTIVISLGSTHSFPLEEVIHYVKAKTLQHTLSQAVLAIPLFNTRWRWVASIALAIRRNRNGQRVPAQFQRMDAEDLVALIFPDQLACQDNIAGEREIPDHPLINQTLHDCLQVAMDVEGLETTLTKIETNDIKVTVQDLTTPSPLAEEILHARPYAFLDDAPAEERRTRAIATQNIASPLDAAAFAKLDPNAINKVALEAWPKIESADALHDALMQLGFLTAEEIDKLPANIKQYLQELIENKRATKYKVDEHLCFWVCAERLPLLSSIHPQAILDPVISPVGSLTHKNWGLEEALIELLRGRLLCSGPVSVKSLAHIFGLAEHTIQSGLIALEQQGSIMQGHYSQSSEVEWCERGLLARIHRYTLQSLRQQYKPVSATHYMRFLLRWHGINGDAIEAENGLNHTLYLLEGFSASAAAWETDILPARLQNYTPHYLDTLCNSGQFTWLRAIQPVEKKHSALRSTPISFIPRATQKYWLSLNQIDNKILTLSSTAKRVLDFLTQQGASFFDDITNAHTNILPSQLDDALSELVVNGIINSDNFSGIRELILKKKKTHRQRNKKSRNYFTTTHPLNNAGRWAIINRSPYKSELDNSVEHRWLSQPYPILEHIAKTLLRRYGIVFRSVLAKESFLPPWRELLYVYRRLEARGEINGGRFVEGFSGEQFALADAVGILRKPYDTDTLNVLSAADPLNLTGVILPGQRVPALANNHIVLCDGKLIGWRIGKEAIFIEGIPPQTQAQARSLLLKSNIINRQRYA